MNLIATVTLALPLAVEALEPGLMTRPPRPPAAPIAQFELRDDQTIVVTTIVLFQVVYLLECRSLRHSVLHVGLWTNPWALAGIGAVLALQAAFVYAPADAGGVRSAPLSADDWLLALGAAATVAAGRRPREVVAAEP